MSPTPPLPRSTVLVTVLLLAAWPVSARDSSEICTAAALVEAIESGPTEGTASGMADDTVATALSNNAVLTTLTQALTSAGLVSSLDAAESATVFAPTDCAFDAVDPTTLQAAMTDPTGLLRTVLGFHVIPGRRLSAAELSGKYETFTGETLTVVEDGTVGGQATISVPDIATANATVHLIDTVMLPPRVTRAVDGATADDTPRDRIPAAGDADARSRSQDAAAPRPVIVLSVLGLALLGAIAVVIVSSRRRLGR